MTGVKATGTSNELDTKLETIFGANTVQVPFRQKYPLPVADGGPGWNGGYRFGVVFTAEPGNMPDLVASATVAGAGSAFVVGILTGTTNPVDGMSDLTGAAEYTVDGNQVGGTFSLQLLNYGKVSQTTTTITIGIASLTTTTFAAAFNGMCAANLNCVGVTRSATANVAAGYTWTVEFTAQELGANIGLMTVASPALTGRNAAVLVADHIQGNELSGTFRLSLGGYVSAEISFQASQDVVATELEKLPSIGSVSVQRAELDDAAKQVRAMRWTVTF